MNDIENMLRNGDSIEDILAAGRIEPRLPERCDELFGSIRNEIQRRRTARRRRRVRQCRLATVCVVVLAAGFAIWPPRLGSDAATLVGLESGKRVVRDELGHMKFIITSEHDRKAAQQSARLFAADAGTPVRFAGIWIGDETYGSVGRAVTSDGESWTHNSPYSRWTTMSGRTKHLVVRHRTEVWNLDDDPDANYLGWEVVEVDGIPFHVHMWAKIVPELGRVILGEGPPVVPFD